MAHRVAAGFGENDLSVEVRENALIVSASKADEDDSRTYLHRGIAARAANRAGTWTVEVSIDQAEHGIEPWQIMRNTDVIGDDGHSDYGHAFEVFWERYGKDVGPKTTVLLLGDARNNYHASQSWVVKEMQKKSRDVSRCNSDVGGFIFAQFHLPLAYMLGAIAFTMVAGMAGLPIARPHRYAVSPMRASLGARSLTSRSAMRANQPVKPINRRVLMTLNRVLALAI